MVNFGYGPGMRYWQEDRKDILAEELRRLLRNTKFELKPSSPNPYDEDVCIQILPYVEIDGLYSGVRIRKLTHLTEKSMDSLIENAEEVYRRVMTHDIGYYNKLVQEEELEK